MKNERIYHRGDVFLAYLGNPFGSEQGGLRPVVIMQNDWECVYSPTVTMVPLTSNLKKVHLASHYVLQDAFFLKRVSMVLGEQIDTIDKHRLHTFLGRLSEKDMAHTAEAVREHLGFYIYESPLSILVICQDKYHGSRISAGQEKPDEGLWRGQRHPCRMEIIGVMVWQRRQNYGSES